MPEPDQCSWSDASLCHTQRSPRTFAFTLIELLVVTAVIGILAALLFPTIKAVTRIKRASRARAELAQMETFIAAYKARMGHYPPDNRNPITRQLLVGLNPLYYELAGTVCTGADFFITKDQVGPPLTSAMIKSFFGPGVSGFMNSDRGDTDDNSVAVRLLTSLKPNQVTEVTMTNPGTRMTVSAKILVCTVPGTDSNIPPLNNGSPPLNPWRYNSSDPTNNSTTYDLWTDILINGKIWRICNWSSKPLPVQ